jgi:SAM-dependent methyltransferase
MASIVWDRELAEVYDRTYRATFEPSVLGPMVDLLAGLAEIGPALDSVGTGRVALALSARGIVVHGLELSPHMAAQLSAKPGAEAVPVTIGDMTAARVPGAPFALVYLVANTIMNVTTQDGQLAVFANAAGHLEPGGCFVLEVIVPQLRRVPPARPPGFSPSTPITSGSRPSTTRSGRSRGRITGSRPAAAWCATPRPTGTSGRPNST